MTLPKRRQRFGDSTGNGGDAGTGVHVDRPAPSLVRSDHRIGVTVVGAEATANLGGTIVVALRQAIPAISADGTGRWRLELQMVHSPASGHPPTGQTSHRFAIREIENNGRIKLHQPVERPDLVQLPRIPIEDKPPLPTALKPNDEQPIDDRGG